eukprot:Skav226821  [mRNA]  locus=scaffold606:116024:125447:- [translate_table: standard]
MPPRLREDHVLTSASVGLRVKRGPDWEWRDQDDGGLGITVDIEARYDLIVVGRSMEATGATGSGNAAASVHGYTGRDADPAPLVSRHPAAGSERRPSESEEIQVEQRNVVRSVVHTGALNHQERVVMEHEIYMLFDSGVDRAGHRSARRARPPVALGRPGWRSAGAHGGAHQRHTRVGRGVGADDAYDLIVVSPLRVSHAGGRGSSVNGRYVPTDSYNGKPKYRQQNGQAIIYFDVFWKINFRDDCRGWYYSHPHHDAVVPPRGEWTTEGYSGGDADPAPEVVRAFDVGDLVRFVNVEDLQWSSVPGPSVTPALGSAFTISEVRGEWFQDASNHWGPLSSVEVCQEAVVAVESDDWGPGYDEIWISPEAPWKSGEGHEAEKSKCPICLLVARNALAHECGELFCEDCWVRCQAEDDRCPVCRQDAQNVAPACANRRSILNLQIACPKKCGQVCCLGDKETHLGEHCGHRFVQCPDCGQDVAAQDLAEHQAVLCRSSWPVCELCGQKVKDLAAHLAAESGAHMALMLRNLSAMRQEMTDLKAENRQLQERLLGEPGGAKLG